MVVAVWISIFGPTYSLSATQSTYPAAKSHQQQRMMYVNPQRNSPAHNHRLTRTPRGLPASYTRLARNDLVAADLARRALLAAPRCPLRAAHHRGNRHRGGPVPGCEYDGKSSGVMSERRDGDGKPQAETGTTAAGGTGGAERRRQATGGMKANNKKKRKKDKSTRCSPTAQLSSLASISFAPVKLAVHRPRPVSQPAQTLTPSRPSGTTATPLPPSWSVRSRTRQQSRVPLFAIVAAQLGRAGHQLWIRCLEFGLRDLSLFHQ